VQYYFFRKEMEGDPHVKGHRKQLARELAEEEPGQAVAKANAVVVNPTHFAIALRLHENEPPVPLVLERGVGEHAARMM
jgi:type III secretion protein U